MTANEKIKIAKLNANINDNESMRDLFRSAANAYYLGATKKTYSELSEDGYFAENQWADGIIGNEFDSIGDCIDAAQNEATFALEREMEDAE